MAIKIMNNSCILETNDFEIDLRIYLKISGNLARTATALPPPLLHAPTPPRSTLPPRQKPCKGILV